MGSKQQSLILRIWVDETGQPYGQVSDPHTNWRRPFHSATDLWALLSHVAANLEPSLSSSAKLLNDSESQNNEP